MNQFDEATKEKAKEYYDDIANLVNNDNAFSAGRSSAKRSMEILASGICSLKLRHFKACEASENVFGSYDIAGCHPYCPIAERQKIIDEIEVRGDWPLDDPGFPPTAKKEE